MMNDLNGLREKANSLRRENRYLEALEPYRIIWEETEGSRDKWDGWGYAFCLNKCGFHEKALKVCKEIYQ